MKKSMIHNQQVAIVLTNISKKYEIFHEKPTLVERFFKGRTEKFVALNAINLVIKKGERVGILGLNGSGKTTLLKIIAGITSPTTGTVGINGKIVSLIDLEAGFHSDLTGEQNIYIQGMLLGMRKEEIKRKSHHIIAFADIGRFIDAPLFTYSVGMKLRLGFSVAVHMDPDILILDEGVSAGDIRFQKKSITKIRELFRLGKTVVMASHWLDFVRQNCHRILIMERGKITAQGTEELIAMYEHSSRKKP